MGKNNDNKGNNKTFWVTALAIALGVSITSCQNEKLLEEAQKKNLPNANDIKLSEMIKPAEIDYSKYKLEDIKTVDDYLREMEEQASQEEESNKILHK